LTTKLQALVDALGNPLRLILTPGQAGDLTQGELLVSGYSPEPVIADQADDSDHLVVLREETGALATIPPRSHRFNPRDDDMMLTNTTNDI
jgi:transposase